MQELPTKETTASREFKMIEIEVRNTHVQQVFSVFPFISIL